MHTNTQMHTHTCIINLIGIDFCFVLFSFLVTYFTFCIYICLVAMALSVLEASQPNLFDSCLCLSSQLLFLFSQTMKSLVSKKYGGVDGGFCTLGG